MKETEELVTPRTCGEGTRKCEGCGVIFHGVPFFIGKASELFEVLMTDNRIRDWCSECTEKHLNG